MKTIFFEIQDWEQKDIAQAFPNAQFTPEKLTSQNVIKYTDADIISTFIYSTVNKQVVDQMPNLKLVAT